MNRVFNAVVEGCAERLDGNTWITFEVKRAWQQLYESGQAHSVEVWHQQNLVDGLYGLALGQIFW